MIDRLLRGAMLSGLALSMVFLVGCDDDDDNGGMMPLPGDTALRVIHASPDAPAVDIYAEGVSTPLFADVSYGEATGYVDLTPGTYNIQLRPAGAAPSTAPVYETGDVTVALEEVYTAVAVGLLGSADAADSFRVLPYLENFGPGDAGNARVRIVHGSADAPVVSIDVGDDGVPDVNDLARFAETGEAGVLLPASTPLQLGIWAGAPLARVTAFTTPALPANTNVFVIATGLVARLPREQDGFALLAVGPTGAIGFIKQNPVLYALHASPDAPAVDILAGGAELVTNLVFGALSAPLQVPPGTYDLEFEAAASGATAATATTPNLAAGERYLAVATGFLTPEMGRPAFQLAAFRDGFTLGGASPLLRVVHASPDAPAVDVGTVSGMAFTPIPDFTNLAFAEASTEAGAEVPAAALTVGVAATGTTTPAASFDLSPTAALRGYGIAAGALAASPGEEDFRLIVVDTAASPWSATEVIPN